MVVEASEDPVTFLLSVMNDDAKDLATRIRAAGLAAQYTNVKKADGGRKEDRQSRANQAALGRFSATTAPKLVVNNKR